MKKRKACEPVECVTQGLILMTQISLHVLNPLPLPGTARLNQSQEKMSAGLSSRSQASQNNYYLHYSSLMQKHAFYSCMSLAQFN